MCGVDMSGLRNFPNIGIVLEKQLSEIGIEKIEELRDMGSKLAWLKIKKNDSSACYNRLCALEGAILGIKKSELNAYQKKDLKKFYNSNK